MQLADVERIIEVLLNSLHKGVHWAMGRWHSWNEWTNTPPNTVRVGFCKLKLCPFIFLLENHCPWNACTMLMHTDWPVTVLHSLKDTTKWEKIYSFRQTLSSSESIMKISLSEKVKPIGGFLKATLFLIATRGRNLWLQKESSLKKI